MTLLIVVTPADDVPGGRPPAIPLWFGPEERPLFGWFHTPAGGEAKAGAVICPPLAREYLDSHYALRMLAEALTDFSVCAVRFDYDGTGDSAGDESDPDRVESWLASIAEAVALLRDAGAESINAVGLRMGATLAAIAAERDGRLDGLVLWDPVVSGRRYLVEQTALTAFSSHEPVRRSAGFVEAPGLVFGPATARDIKALDLTRTCGSLANRLLVASRPDRSYGDLVTHLHHTRVEWCEATGLADLMDVESPNQLLPHDLIRQTADWMAGGVTASPRHLSLPTRPSAAVVGTTPRGAPVVEQVTTIAPAGLFAITTGVQEPTAGPTALFLNVANEHRTGPARMWVQLARRWAEHGIRSVRVDMSGLGDSPTRDATQPPFVARLPAAFDDVLDAAKSACPDDPSNVILIGLCSSAYQALDSALEIHPRGVVAIQPVLSFQPPEVVLAGRVDSRRRFALPRSALVEAFHADGPLAFLRRRFPNLGWQLRTLALAHRGPKRWLRELNRCGTEVLILCGEWESRPFRHGLSERAMERLRTSGRVRFEYRPDLEHGLLRAVQRSDMSDLITDHVLTRFAPPPAGTSTAEERLHGSLAVEGGLQVDSSRLAPGTAR